MPPKKNKKQEEQLEDSVEPQPKKKGNQKNAKTVDCKKA